MFFFGYAAWASPESDAAFLVDHFTTDELRDSFRDEYLRAYVKSYSKLLNERSVKVIDHDVFASLFPESAIDDEMEGVRQSFIDHFVRELEPDELKSFVIHVKYRPQDQRHYGPSSGPPSEVPVPLDEWLEHWNGVLSDEQFATDMVNDMNLALLIFGFMLKIGTKPEIEADLKAPFVADMLETDGVFQFPNPIYRRDLIREARGGMR